LDVGAGDHVLTTCVSDYGSHLGILAQNALPVFCDIDPDTGNMTAETIRAAMTPETKAIIVVHWQGLLCDMDPIIKLSEETGIPIIEDCCQCPLGKYKGRSAGSMGIMGCFSCDAEKHFSTEHGGVVISNSKELIDKCYQYAVMRGAYMQPGYGRRYNMMGLNYRFGQMEAAVGLAQLTELPRLNENRCRTMAQLSGLLCEIPGVDVLHPPSDVDCLYWIFPIMFDMGMFDADIYTLGEAINAEGVSGCSHLPYYYLPESHELLKSRGGLYGDTGCPFDCPYQKGKNDYTALSLPGAMTYINRTVRWVISDQYSEEDVRLIALAVKKVADHFRKQS